MIRCFLFFMGAVIFLLLPSVYSYEIIGDSVQIDNSEAFISVTPHTLIKGTYQNITVISKTYTGNIDIAFGFDSNKAKPKALDLYKPYSWNETKSTTRLVNIGNNETPIWENQTTYWNQTYSTNWESITELFNKVTYNYEGFDTWYIAKNVPIIAGQEYTTRLKLKTKINTAGKFWIGFKPSFKTLSQAISTGHFYFIDPWWNDSYSSKSPILNSSAIDCTKDWANYTFRFVGCEDGECTNVTFMANASASFRDSGLSDNINCTALTSVTVPIYWWYNNTDGNPAVVFDNGTDAVAIDWINATPLNDGNSVTNGFTSNMNNGSRVYHFFDDFNGASIDYTDRWSGTAGGDQGKYSVSGGILSMTQDDADGLKSSAARHFANSSIEYSIRNPVVDTGLYVYFPTADDNQMIRWDDASNIYQSLGSSQAIVDMGGDNTADYFYFTYLAGGSDVMTFYNYSDFPLQLKATKSGTATTAKATINAFAFSGSGAGHIDWVRVGRRNAVHPTMALGAILSHIPIVTIDSPENITYFNTTTIEINVSATQTTHNWWYQYNGNGTNITFTPNTTIYASGGSGPKNITVWANNTNGTGQQVAYFSTDPNNPIISSATPANAITTSNTSIIINIIATDGDTDTLTYSLIWNDTLIEANTNGSFNYTHNDVESLQNWSVNVSDGFINTSLAVRNITIDYTHVNLYELTTGEHITENLTIRLRTGNFSIIQSQDGNNVTFKNIDRYSGAEIIVAASNASSSYFPTQLISDSYTIGEDFILYHISITDNYALNTLKLQDFIGTFKNAEFQAWAYIGDDFLPIFEDIFDVEDKVAGYFDRDTRYTLYVRNDFETRSIGDFRPKVHGDTAIVTIGIVTFSPDANRMIDFVTFEWNTTNDTIIFSWLDELNETDWVEFYVYNLTNFSQQIHFSNCTNSTLCSFSYTVDNSNLTYTSYFIAYGTRWGFSPFDESKSHYFLSDTRRVDLDLPEDQEIWYWIFSIVLVVLASMMFSRRHSALGGVASMGVGSFCVYIGWLIIPMAFFAVLIVIAIIHAIRRRER